MDDICKIIFGNAPVDGYVSQGSEGSGKDCGSGSVSYSSVVEGIDAEIASYEHRLQGALKSENLTAAYDMCNRLDSLRTAKQGAEERRNMLSWTHGMEDIEGGRDE